MLLRYPVRVKNKDEVLRQARRRRVELGDWFNHPLHPREANAEAFGYRRGFCPEGERAANEVVNLPLTERTTEKTARYEAVDFLKSRWRRYECAIRKRCPKTANRPGSTYLYVVLIDALRLEVSGSGEFSSRTC